MATPPTAVLAGRRRSLTCPGGMTTTGGKGGDSPAGDGSPGLPNLGWGSRDRHRVRSAFRTRQAATAGRTRAHRLRETAAARRRREHSSWAPGSPPEVRPARRVVRAKAEEAEALATTLHLAVAAVVAPEDAAVRGRRWRWWRWCQRADRRLRICADSFQLRSGQRNGRELAEAERQGRRPRRRSAVAGAPSQGGCAGGHGGTGGTGGSGGGGAGGVSAGILYKGTAPTLDTATTSKFVQGLAGTKGTGGVPGTNDGIDGPTGIQVLGQ